MTRQLINCGVLSTRHQRWNANLSGTAHYTRSVAVAEEIRWTAHPSDCDCDYTSSESDAPSTQVTSLLLLSGLWTCLHWLQQCWFWVNNDCTQFNIWKWTDSHGEALSLNENSESESLTCSDIQPSRLFAPTTQEAVIAPYPHPRTLAFHLSVAPCFHAFLHWGKKGHRPELRSLRHICFKNVPNSLKPT